MRNSQRSGSRRREKRKMVSSVLAPGKLCWLGSEAPKPLEFGRDRAVEVESQRERTGLLLPLLLCLPLSIFFGRKKLLRAFPGADSSLGKEDSSCFQSFTGNKISEYDSNQSWRYIRDVPGSNRSQETVRWKLYPLLI